MQLIFALAAATSYLLAAQPPRQSGRSRGVDVKCGLLDWMLDDAAIKPPIEQFCRPEGWDCDLRLQVDLVSKDKGPLTVSALINVGLRFRRDGAVSLVQPSKHFATTPGSWHAVEMQDDCPSLVRWRLQAGELGACDIAGSCIVAPGAELLGTFRLDPASPTLLCGGELWLEQTPEAAEAMLAVGTARASPMALMGSA